MNDRQNYLLAAAQFISLYLGYENLLENRAQTAANDVNAANNKQADLMLNDIHQQFAAQNQMIMNISNKLDFLIEILLNS